MKDNAVQNPKPVDTLKALKDAKSQLEKNQPHRAKGIIEQQIRRLEKQN